VFPDDTRIINQTILQVEPLADYSLFQQGFVERKNSNQLIFIPVLINAREIFDIDVLTTREGFNQERVLSYHPVEIKFEYKIFGISRLNYVSGIKTSSERLYSAATELVLVA
jgi:hypothetical protein